LAAPTGNDHSSMRITIFLSVWSREKVVLNSCAKTQRSCP